VRETVLYKYKTLMPNASARPKPSAKGPPSSVELDRFPVEVSLSFPVAPAKAEKTPASQQGKAAQTSQQPVSLSLVPTHGGALLSVQGRFP